MGRKAIHTRPKTIYSNWHNMVSRCNRPNSPEYPRYGGRGITICPEWLSYNQFYDDMIDTYESGLTLDRIDNSKGYIPENCKWSTPKEQALNRRSNRYLTVNGETLTVKEWSIKTKIKYSTITQRIDYYGWTVERALGFGG